MSLKPVPAEVVEHPTTPVDEEWLAAVSFTTPELRPALEAFAKAGLPVPEVGYAFCDQADRVRAEAELGWPARRAAVWLPEQSAAADPRAPALLGSWRLFDANSAKLIDEVLAAFGEEE